MILCLCRGVSDRTVHQVIDEGARTVAEVGRRCGAGTDCGSCHEAIAQRLAESRSSHLPSVPNVSRACAGCPGGSPGVASAPEEEAA